MDEKGKSVIERIRLGLGNIYVRIILVAIIVVCGIIIYMDSTKKEEKQEIVEKVKEEVVVEDKKEERIISIDFDRLHEINPDIYAWIMVPGTNINYPVLQSPEGEDTDYYLETNLDGSKGLPGSIYTQLRNAKDFSDKDTVVYGHDMKNGTMFKTLHDFEDTEFFNANRYIYIYTPEKCFVYEIFAAVTSDDKLILDYYGDFAEQADFEAHLEELRNLSGNHAEGVEVTGEDRIITLSTCIATAPDNRFLVVGKLLSDEEVEALGETELDAADENAKSGQNELTGDEDESDETENSQEQ